MSSVTTLLQAVVEVRQRKLDRRLKLQTDDKDAVAEDEIDDCRIELLQAQLELAKHMSKSPATTEE